MQAKYTKIQTFQLRPFWVFKFSSGHNLETTSGVWGMHNASLIIETDPASVAHNTWVLVPLLLVNLIHHHPYKLTLLPPPLSQSLCSSPRTKQKRFVLRYTMRFDSFKSWCYRLNHGREGPFKTLITIHVYSKLSLNWIYIIQISPSTNLIYYICM